VVNKNRQLREIEQGGFDHFLAFTFGGTKQVLGVNCSVVSTGNFINVHIKV
jgi:hypothetical protein